MPPPRECCVAPALGPLAFCFPWLAGCPPGGLLHHEATGSCWRPQLMLEECIVTTAARSPTASWDSCRAGPGGCAAQHDADEAGAQLQHHRLRRHQGPGQRPGREHVPHVPRAQVRPPALFVAHLDALSPPLWLPMGRSTPASSNRSGNPNGCLWASAPGSYSTNTVVIITGQLRPWTSRSGDPVVCGCCVCPQGRARHPAKIKFERGCQAWSLPLPWPRLHRGRQEHLLHMQGTIISSPAAASSTSWHARPSRPSADCSAAGWQRQLCGVAWGRHAGQRTEGQQGHQGAVHQGE